MYSKECNLFTCLRSVRLSVCVCLGGGSRGMLSKSMWLWGLMGLKRSVATVIWWENSSGWECTDPLEPAHENQWVIRLEVKSTLLSILFLITWLGPRSAQYVLRPLHLCYKLCLCHMVTRLWRQEHVAVIGQGVCAPYCWFLDTQQVALLWFTRIVLLRLRTEKRVRGSF